MQVKFVLLNTGCLFLSLMMLVGCNGQGSRPGGDYPFDSANAARYIIPIEQARKYQRNFINSRNDLQKMLKDTGYLNKNFNIPNGEAFSKDALLLLLNQKDAAAIRFYYGKDEKGVVRLVLLPIRKDGTVIYNKLRRGNKTQPSMATDSTADSSASKAPVALEADAVETGQTCPPCILD